MARGAASPPVNLPKVSFVKVTEETAKAAPGVHDGTARTYGYNNFDPKFAQPQHYIRYIEPLESDLATQVEYDMDEQDQEWLDAVNMERKSQQLDKVSYETFEIIMDRLEKEWFDLSKNVPKTDMGLPSEESRENTNAIVFCDGCNLAVHQDCYGVPYIPEGQWLCRKCTVCPEVPVECILCPNEGGAFKQTVSGEWVHLLCAIWVPETGVANDVFMEPVTGVDKISKQRWKLRCSVCGKKQGACVQCSKPSCFTAFHATCARREKLLMPMKAIQGSEAPTLACYCEKHLPREQYDIREAMLSAREMDMDVLHPSPKSNKTARAYAKTYKPGPPLVPKIMVNRIIQYTSRIHFRQKSDFVHAVCKYWSLKREARRGAPLLKRLHLEPWTALSGTKQHTDEEKALKLDYMKRLRNDLGSLHTLAGLVKKREKAKREQYEVIQSVLERFFFPHEAYLRYAFEKITSPDRQDYFKSPVNRAEVPDYYDVIKEPMCWDTIDQKLDRHEYLDLSQFKHDIELVLDNAITYNEPNSPYYKVAMRIRNNLPMELDALDSLMNHSPPPLQEPMDVDIEEDSKPPAEPQPTASPQLPTLPPLGDLEPPFPILDLLESEETIRQATTLIITSNPIQSLLNLEHPLIRPPAPPPPGSKKASGSTKGTDRKAALARKRAERQAALDASPGFRSLRSQGGPFDFVPLRSSSHPAPEPESESEAPELEVEPEAGPSSVQEPAVDVNAHADESVDIDIDIDIEGDDEAGPGTVNPDGLEVTNDMTQEPEAATAAQEPGPEQELQLEPEPAEPEGQPEEEPEPVKKPRKPRQRHLPPPPKEVRDVGSWDSFKQFEQGWILPPEQKRGGRRVVERGPAPPPRKRQKRSTRFLFLSFSDRTSRRNTAASPKPPPEAESESTSEDERLGRSSSSSTSTRPRSGARSSNAPGSSARTSSASRRVLRRCPSLRSPTSLRTGRPARRSRARPPRSSPRRLRCARRNRSPSRAGEQAWTEARAEGEAEGPAAAASSAGPADAQTQSKQKGKQKAQPKQKQKRRGKKAGALEESSDLTDLSDETDAETEQGKQALPLVAPPQARIVKRRRVPKPLDPNEPGVITLKPGEKLEGGTLVWAKIGTFPWWPAVIFEEDDRDIPATVLSQKPTGLVGCVLVRFYEKKRAGVAWLPLRNLRYLGENNTLDGQMLAASSKYQTWKNSVRRTECRNAYQYE
ncbi:uncharacterized protein BXZ73DRAFT_89157 [Epithele typhae]|uniref:uncharacterized protein n=1 Tax=Epithele typhae TaxID=378194 RepID=UPI0020080062|nr:uncharacterized protein BXZ73DRAFT_89157 [Epithele typhae]KAH9939113.1 hypothetical protein BXZ73DRAFT_89157 [Epithele typhae]